MGEIDWGGNWVLFRRVGPCSVNLESNFLLVGGAVYPLYCLAWGQTLVEVMKIMVTSFQRSHACTAALRALDPAAGHHWPTLLPETSGHSQASLGQSLVGSLLLSRGSWCAQGFVCALQASVSPVLCEFWQLCDGIIGDLLQEALCHTQVCCSQSHCPWGSPLLTCTSARDTQTQIWLSLCGVSGSWCAPKRAPSEGLFELSEHLWRVWGLILNVILHLLPSCWGFSFALGRGVSLFGVMQHSPFDGCS